MQLPIQGITLRIVKYSDSTSIATIWTRQAGRIAAAIPAGSGKNAQRLRAIMMPFGVFEAIATVKQGQEIARLTDVRPLVQSPASSGNPAKSVMAMFISDFLYATLKEGAGDDLLADFLIESARCLLDIPAARTANFHLCFLYRLSRFLGVEPDMGTYHTGSFFDIKEARFTESMPVHTQSVDETGAWISWMLSRLNYRNMHLLRLNREQRNIILDRIIDYYTIHYCSVSALPSLPILRSLFSA